MEHGNDPLLQEKKEHGRPDFLFNIYPCTIPLDFSEVSTHWHDTIEMISIRKGAGSVELDFASHSVAAGDLILIRPGRLHAIRAKGDRPMEYENIMIDPRFLLSDRIDVCTREYFQPFIEGRCSFPAVYEGADPNSEPLRECIAKIDSLSTSRETAWELGVKSALFSFFFLLFSRYGSGDTLPEKSRRYETLKEILGYVRKNFSRPITVGDAAASIGYSTSHFMRFFRQQTNMTFISYVNDYRLSEAAGLLATTSASVLEIAGSCGYENLSLFNRQFKRKYQMTPSAYREQYLYKKDD